MAKRGDTKRGSHADHIDQHFMKVGGATVDEQLIRIINQEAAALNCAPRNKSSVIEHLKFRAERGWKLTKLGFDRYHLTPPPGHEFF